MPRTPFFLPQPGSSSSSSTSSSSTSSRCHHDKSTSSNQSSGTERPTSWGYLNQIDSIIDLKAAGVEERSPPHWKRFQRLNEHSRPTQLSSRRLPCLGKSHQPRARHVGLPRAQGEARRPTKPSVVVLNDRQRGTTQGEARRPTTGEGQGTSAQPPSLMLGKERPTQARHVGPPGAEGERVGPPSCQLKF